MIRPENLPPKDCGNFLADLPRYLGIEDAAFQQEQVYPHYNSCPRCRQNLGTAREMAGAFTGLKPRIAASSAAHFSLGSRMQTIEKAVRLALDSNRAELSQIFTNLGKSLYIEALRLNEEWDPKWVSTGPLRETSAYRKTGMDLANDSALFCRDAEEKSLWKESQEELARNPAQSAWQSCLDESLRYLVVARRIEPGNEAATIHLAQNYFLRNEPELAMEAANRVIRESNSVLKLSQAHNNLGVYLFNSQRHSEALEHCFAAIHLTPEEPTMACNVATYSLFVEDRETSFRTYAEIESNSQFVTRAKDLLVGTFRRSMAAHCFRFPKDLVRLEKEFPNIFAPEVSRKLRSEVSS